MELDCCSVIFLLSLRLVFEKVDACILFSHVFFFAIFKFCVNFVRTSIWMGFFCLKHQVFRCISYILVDLDSGEEGLAARDTDPYDVGVKVLIWKVKDKFCRLGVLFPRIFKTLDFCGEGLFNQVILIEFLIVFLKKVPLFYFVLVQRLNLSEKIGVSFCLSGLLLSLNCIL